jgi:hypothetical protein
VAVVAVAEVVQVAVLLVELAMAIHPSVALVVLAVVHL